VKKTRSTADEIRHEAGSDQMSREQRGGEDVQEQVKVKVRKQSAASRPVELDLRSPSGRILKF
jgi:hypothetical protein